MRSWGFAAGVAFVVLGVAVSAGGTQAFDEALLPVLRAAPGSALATAALFLTQAGSTPAIAASALLWAVLRWHADRAGVWAGLALAAAGGVLTWALKALWARPRPEGMLVEATGSAFPSGHALAGLLWYAGVAWLWGRGRPHPARWTAAGVAAGFLLGVTRWILGVHHVTDVLAGWALAVAGLAVLVDAPLARLPGVDRGAVGDEPAVEAGVGRGALDDDPGAR